LDKIADQLGEGTCPDCAAPLVALMDVGEVFDVGSGRVETNVCGTCGRERPIIKLHWPEQ
jgi:hypothetical protein